MSTFVKSCKSHRIVEPWAGICTHYARKREFLCSLLCVLFFFTC